MFSRLSRRLLIWTASVILFFILLCHTIPIFNGNTTVSHEDLFSQNAFSQKSTNELVPGGEGPVSNSVGGEESTSNSVVGKESISNSVGSEESRSNSEGGEKSISNSESESSATLSSKHPISLDPNITKRGEWQTKQINNYCQNHNPAQLYPNFYAFLLYDDDKKIVFCYVPKVGCSKWKYMFLLLAGKQSLESDPSTTVLRKVNKLSDLSDSEKKKRLNTYFKYIFIRNPMERVVSAYLDKIAKPLNKSMIKLHKNEEKFKASIVKKWRPEDYNAWVKDGRATYPTFSEYVDYINIIDLRSTKTDEHFKPIVYLCLPCLVNYNFYGNFKLLSDDSKEVLDRLKLNSSYYDQSSFISHKSYKTSDLVTKYFSQLTAEQKQKLFHTYTDELNFYYSLYPEETDSHLNLL